MSFLKKWFDRFSKSGKEKTNLTFDLNHELNQIKKKEAAQKIEPGRKIHAFEYREFEIRFDRDITHNGRICVFDGNERLYSFTVFAKTNERQKLEKAFKDVLFYLDSERALSHLPDSKLLKGFYYGHH